MLQFKQFYHLSLTVCSLQKHTLVWLDLKHLTRSLHNVINGQNNKGPVPSKLEIVAQFHFQSMSRFPFFILKALKLIYNMVGLLPYSLFGVWNPVFNFGNAVIFYWLLTCSVSHIYLSFLINYGLFWKNSLEKKHLFSWFYFLGKTKSFTWYSSN